MERYEYMIGPLGRRRDRLERINRLGANGWEFVSIYRNQMYFKRIKRSV